jgi:hypothetical protein
VTVVSERPLRVDVRSRSTTITDLLTEFATATDSDLIISTREDYPVRAVSLSGLTPESLFALLSENQMFEILYESPPGEARRIRLIPHRMISRRIDPRATLPPEKTAPDPDTLSGTIPTDLSRPPDQTDTVESSIGRQQRPGVSSTPLYTRIQSRSTRILVRHPDSQPVPEISSPVTSETKSAPKQSDGQEPPDAQPGRRLVSNSTAANSTAANSTAANSTAAATPASDPATQPVPATDTTAASTPSGPQELSPAADAQTRKQYDIRATVVHLVTTSTAGFEQAGITPIHVPGTRSPSHRTAAQHAVDQAVRLGHVTPVSDASVSITAGQSACLKIGFLCLHCNAEQGLSAGDTLRISVDDTASGHTRVTVQGLTLESSEPLLKPGLFNALLSAPQSFLIAESGTSGSVTVHEKKSALARLPVIGRMLGKSRSRQVRQIAQRLIIVTLIPAEPGLVAEAEATTDQTRLTAARLLPASRSRKNAGQNSPELLPRSLTRSALRASTTGRKPFVLPRFPLPAPVPSSPAATPDTPERLPSVPLNPVREQTPAPEVEAVHTTSRARNS